MSNHDDTWQQLTVAEAAVILGVSTATVRRMVRAGKLAGETVLRPQGKVYVVRLPRQVAASPSHVASTEQVPPDMPRGSAPTIKGLESTGAAHQSSPEQMMAAWSAAVLAPIVAELAASRLANEQKAETIGRLTAELEALRASHSPVAAQETPPVVEATTEPSMATVAPWWRRWLLAVYG